MNLFRRLLSLCLVMTMVVTSGAMATMRSSEDGAQRVVICTGMGPQVILLGADGQEVEPAPICPDCTMVLAAGPLPVSAQIVPLPFTPEVSARQSAQVATLPSVVDAQPRAPPQAAS